MKIRACGVQRFPMLDGFEDCPPSHVFGNTRAHASFRLARIRARRLQSSAGLSHRLPRPLDFLPLQGGNQLARQDGGGGVLEVRWLEQESPREQPTA